MLKCHFMLLKPRLNTSGWVYGWIVILKNCIIGRKQHLDCKMCLITKNAHIATGSNWSIPSNYRTGRIQRYCCPNHHRPPPCFTIGTSKQDYRLPWVFSRHKPSLMLGNSLEDCFLIWLYYVFPASDIQALWPSYNFLTFSVVFSNQRFCNCSCTMDCICEAVVRLFFFFSETRSLRWILSTAVTFAAVL